MKVKFTLLGVCLLGGVLINAQQKGKVGVNTDKPTETLQVDGTLRVTDLPQNEAKNAINTNTRGEDAGAKNQTFNATKTLVVDANGVVGAVDGLLASAKKESVQVNEKDGTELFVPVRRCAKNVIGDGSKRTYTMAFPQVGYTFSWKDSGAGKFALYVKRSGDYESEKVEGVARMIAFSPSSVAFSGGAEGGISISGDKETGVLNSSFSISTAGRASLIIGGTAQTFNIDFTTANKSGVKVMNICIEQTVF
ncbi:hypothetical protein EDL98_00620 [Ornithobacterium rhinotracheale]|uniref:hypothetical protein n=1 Tax=Ornithobacterium rhinotracheale TaxID=28251 RepID=UPI00129C1BAD|nr:hypothetical protein [Ornithobacterium rhinotracheale]MRJ09594.1 hypothetical protein [Ornithobacterium rhinotracheale]